MALPVEALVAEASVLALAAVAVSAVACLVGLVVGRLARHPTGRERG